MTTEHEAKCLNEDSHSVQAHLQLLQSVIQRMAGNSASCKTWCITIVSAIFVTVADKEQIGYMSLALFPTVLFLMLDIYYLALEKGFRKTYGDFVAKLHAGSVNAADLYAIVPAGSRLGHIARSIASFSIWGFYGFLVAIIQVLRHTLG